MRMRRRDELLVNDGLPLPPSIFEYGPKSPDIQIREVYSGGSWAESVETLHAGVEPIAQSLALEMLRVPTAPRPFFPPLHPFFPFRRVHT